MKKKSADADTSKAKKAAPAKKAAAAPAKKAPAAKAAPAKKAAAKAAPAKKKAAGKAEEPSAQIEMQTAVAEVAAAIEAATPPAEPEVVAPPPTPMTEEEQELAALYGDDLSAPKAAHSEFRDKQSADEDRQLMPEINARDERKHQWQDRRDQRRRRRDERRPGGGGGNNGQQQQGGGGGGGGGNNGQQQGQRQFQNGQQGGGGGGNNQNRDFNRDRNRDNNGGNRDQRPPMQQPLPLTSGAASQPAAQTAPSGDLSHDALARVGTPLGDGAATVFAQLRNNQPLPVRQLAQMMRKRNITEHEPDRLTPQLKAELLGDERSYRALGLRPRIVYRGRDMFAPGPVAMSSTADAEAGFAAALSRLAGATHRALAARIARATPAGFERIVHSYLVAAGYHDVDWVKRVGDISYATATAPGLGRMVLISARSGDAPIDRRGIGELRVGVAAKELVAGILFAARELSEDAERELERDGRSIAVMCGDQLVAALIATGVGVVSSAAPVHYVDDQLLDELLAG
jgi:restriction endonuclease Mrr